MPEYYDEQGQKLFVSMEGAPLQEPEIIAKQIILQRNNFPIYFLGASSTSNTMIGKNVSNAFDVIAPPARVPVFWIYELQQTEAVFQNMLSTNRHAVGHNLVLAMKRQVMNIVYSATFRQSTSIAYSLWERADGMQYDQQTAEWTSKLVEYQLEAADKLDAGKLRDKLIKALSWFHTKDLCGRQISSIDVMNHIEKIFVDTGDMKTQNNRFLVKTGTGLPLPAVTRLVNRQFKLIVKLNPVNQGSVAALWPCTTMHGNTSDAPTMSLTNQTLFKDILQQQQ